MSVARADQYVAFAWTANDGVMRDADTVVGDGVVERRRLSSRGPGSLLFNDLQNEEITSAGGVSTLRFSRRLQATQGGEAVSLVEAEDCILSYGDSFGGSDPHGDN
eukprot:scaffold436_cov267-Pinguiococcus_pyrenoidosus.AAC.20